MYRIKQILSLLIAVSLMITSNVYSLPQSKTTLRPPLATSKMAKELEAEKLYGIKRIYDQEAIERLTKMSNVWYLNVSRGTAKYLLRMPPKEAIEGIRRGDFIAGTYEGSIVVVSIDPLDARRRDRALIETRIDDKTAHRGGPGAEENQPDLEVRGAASAEIASGGPGLAEEANVATSVVLTPEAKIAKIDKLRKEAL